MLHHHRASSASACPRHFSRRSVLKGLMVMPLAGCLSQVREAAALAGMSPAVGPEVYHIFVPPELAQQGGTQAFRTTAGEAQTVRIPRACSDGSIVKKRQRFGPDLTLAVHTFDENQRKISQQIGSLIEFQALRPESQQRCRAAYQGLRQGQFVEDLSALALLDFLVAASSLDEQLQQQYRVASFNARTVGLTDQLTQSLEASHLKGAEKQAIWAAAECVRGSKPVFDLAALRTLDRIIQGSDLPTSLKQQYALASATSRALTADIVILNLIQQTYGDRATSAIESYRQVRDGAKVEDDEVIQRLDILIRQANIAPEIQLVYFLARNKTLEQIQGDWAESGESPDLIATSKQLYANAQTIVPVSQAVLGAIGASTTTGVTLSSLAGAVGTNATLSVMGGGLGMLGGLGVVTGGASLLGAATLLMALNVAQLERKEQIHLGIAAATGVTGSAAAVATAWSLVGTYGVASTGTAISSLSGAAAYSATLSVLGGTSALTGGAALLAFGMGYGMWLLLQGRSSDANASQSREAKAQTLEKLELLLYTVQDELTSPRVARRHAVAPQLAHALGSVEDRDLTLAPQIPLRRLKNSLSRFKLAPGEVVLACYESYGFGLGDQYEGFILSDRRIFWKRPKQDPETASYGEPDYLDKVQSLLDIDCIRKQTELYQLIMGFSG